VINEEMKIAASYALAGLAKLEVPESVSQAYGGEKLAFGKKYIIPKPFDPRVLTEVSTAVAQAAIKTGVAKVKIDDWDKYKKGLIDRLASSNVTKK
jgi:malate dehydrogenase (oxaloacetate-decarboxylating)(NADP+)